jgi:hypothetical protein
LLRLHENLRIISVVLSLFVLFTMFDMITILEYFDFSLSIKKKPSHESSNESRVKRRVPNPFLIMDQKALESFFERVEEEKKTEKSEHKIPYNNANNIRIL